MEIIIISCIWIWRHHFIFGICPCSLCGCKHFGLPFCVSCSGQSIITQQLARVFACERWTVSVVLNYTDLLLVNNCHRIGRAIIHSFSMYVLERTKRLICECAIKNERVNTDSKTQKNRGAKENIEKVHMHRMFHKIQRILHFRSFEGIKLYMFVCNVRLCVK